ncbi:MAG: hypothetical protein IJN42_06315, partial [Clostridia bacterium]|nr:hypothetical protein [Clostridia bacterium]
KDADRGLSVRFGDEFSSSLLIRTFACENISKFFEFFFQNRKILMRDDRPANGYTQELWDVMEKHFNEHNYSGKYIGNNRWRLWQCGWCGNAQSVLMSLKQEEINQMFEQWEDETKVKVNRDVLKKYTCKSIAVGEDVAAQEQAQMEALAGQLGLEETEE